MLTKIIEVYGTPHLRMDDSLSAISGVPNMLYPRGTLRIVSKVHIFPKRIEDKTRRGLNKSYLLQRAEMEASGHYKKGNLIWRNVWEDVIFLNPEGYNK